MVEDHVLPRSTQEPTAAHVARRKACAYGVDAHSAPGGGESSGYDGIDGRIKPERKGVFMATETVTLFRPYPFKIGQKIFIEAGPRHGDWEVVGVSKRKVKLRCPISQREFEWNRFCYFTEDDSDSPWPHPD